MSLQQSVEPLDLGDMPKLSINRLERFSPSAYRAGELQVTTTSASNKWHGADLFGSSVFRVTNITMAETTGRSFTACARPLSHSCCNGVDMEFRALPQNVVRVCY
ncbi:hypothetical protein GUJ93_ZPchr0011g26882 [Zizania palustris]|uniref:Uncharacterized protein n=1 Tax=Zizania palustris TaxID=103762 RepID=A0A8J5WMA7_ZIZPA|nr:hypothetical protein GUJ93_ZPchr0011g26882 [Zizania palustris]